MASFAELMVGSGLQNSANAGAGLADAFGKGAELALKAEQVKQQRDQLNSQQAQLEQARLAKFAEAVEKGQQYAGKAQSNYYNKFLPAFRDSLGLTKHFSNDTLAFMSASPENLGRFNTLLADVRSGHKTEQQAIAILQDPVQFGDVPPTSKMMEQIGEASKFSLGQQLERDKQKAQFTQQTTEKATDRAETGNVQLATDTAKAFAVYKNAGGAAAYKKAIEGYQSAIEQLENGKVKLGTWDKKIPWGGDEDVLARVDPQAKLLIDTIRDNINIRAKTGDPNPTEKQIAQILSRSIDPRLDNKANIQKLKAEISRMRLEDKERQDSFRNAGHIKQPKLTPEERNALIKQLNEGKK